MSASDAQLWTHKVIFKYNSNFLLFLDHTKIMYNVLHINLFF